MTLTACLKKTTILIPCAFFLALLGCAQKAHVTYSSNPSSAQIFEGNKSYGSTPLTLTYTLQPFNRKTGRCTKLKTIKAVWVSGVTASTSDNPITICKPGSYKRTLQRPDDNLDGEIEDIAFANQQQRERSRARQVQNSRVNPSALLFLGAVTLGNAYVQGRNTARKQQPPTYNNTYKPNYLQPINTTPNQYFSTPTHSTTNKFNSSIGEQNPVTKQIPSTLRSQKNPDTYLGQLTTNKYNPDAITNDSISQQKVERSLNSQYLTGGPKAYNSDGEFRGNLNGNKYDPNSVSNPHGRYGSEYSPDSINNEYGAGSKYRSDSPNNKYGSGWSVYDD